MNTHEWEQLAQLDPLWAILSDKQKQHISKKDIPVFLSDSLRILKEGEWWSFNCHHLSLCGTGYCGI